MLQRFDGGMDDFLLVSTEEGWRINNNGLRRLEPGKAEELINRYSNLSYMSSWIIEDKDDIFFDSTANSSCKTYINLVKKLPFNSNDKSGLAIAYIPICYFENLLTNNLESETIMVLDENYHVVGHSDFSNIGERLF